MNYIGSKLSLLEFLSNSINKVVDKDYYTFSDLFAGTGIVGRYFKQQGHKVIANDIQYFSYVLNRHYIGNHTDLYFTGLLEEIPEFLTGDVNSYKEIVCNHLDNIPGKKGFIYNNYCLGGTKGKEFERQYFSDENGMKADAIREKIEYWYKKNFINENEYFFLLSSLIESIDKVANTASVYGAFLKKLKKSAQKPLKLIPLNVYVNDLEHEIYNREINNFIKNTSHDVVYLDPPYNHRQYAGNYHILETIARYDNPVLRGKVGMRDCSSQSSLYCKRQKVKDAFDDLMTNIKANYVFFSYNDEGLMSPEDIKEIMSKRGEYGYFTQSYSRFKADKDKNRNYKKDSVTEYLHYVKIK